MSASPLVIPNPGTVVPSGSLITPTGSMGPVGPQGVSADATNQLVIGSDGMVSLPGSVLWYQRLRSYNSVVNPNFEVNQLSSNAVRLVDRWNLWKTAGITAAVSSGPVATSAGCLLPGTSYRVTSQILTFQVTTAQAAAPGGSDGFGFYQYPEGIAARELVNDVTSLSLMVFCNVAGLKFTVALRDGSGVYSIVYLCTIQTASQWTVIPLPNIPAFPSGSTVGLTPGSNGYNIFIVLACGPTLTAPNTGIWNTTGGYVGAPGMSNFLSTVGNIFYCAFVQHEPGSVCTALIDKPFLQNYQECLRYYQKNTHYANTPCTGNWKLVGTLAATNSTQIRCLIRFTPEMAKTPTVRWTGNSTALGNVFLESVGLVAVGSTGVGTSGVQSITLSAAPTCAAYADVLADWDADTLIP